MAEWAQLSGVTDRHYASLDETLEPAASLLLISSFLDAGSEELPAETWTAAAGKPELLVKRVRPI